MDKFEIALSANLDIQQVEQVLYDEINKKYNSEVREVETVLQIEESYKNNTVLLDNKIELNCLISLDPLAKKWDITVWRM